MAGARGCGGRVRAVRRLRGGLNPHPSPHPARAHLQRQARVEDRPRDLRDGRADEEAGGDHAHNRAEGLDLLHLLAPICLICFLFDLFVLGRRLGDAFDGVRVVLSGAVQAEGRRRGGESWAGIGARQRRGRQRRGATLPDRASRARASAGGRARRTVLGKSLLSPMPTTMGAITTCSVDSAIPRASTGTIVPSSRWQSNGVMPSTPAGRWTRRAARRSGVHIRARVRAPDALCARTGGLARRTARGVWTGVVRAPIVVEVVMMTERATSPRAM